MPVLLLLASAPPGRDSEWYLLRIEAFDYGTDRYKAALEGSETAQRLSDVKDQKALYEAGRVSGVDADNIASLQAEHERLLTAVSKDVDGKDKVSRAKLEAVQELWRQTGQRVLKQCMTITLR